MFLRILLFLVVAAAVAAGLAFADFRTALETPVDLSAVEGDTFSIESGWSAKRIGNELARRNIIEKPHWFYLNARLEKKAGAIKKGEYELTPEMTGGSLLDLFVEGQSKLYTFSVIEGHAFKQLLERLSAAEHLQSTLQGTPNGDAERQKIMAMIGKPELHFEGQFFSDTYSFPKNTTDIDFLKRAHQALEKVLDEEWQNRAPDLPYKTPYEALIMASIIEKETAVSSERPRIAGVFVSRLRKRMRLQTDPTVIYGMGDNYDGNIRRSDLKRDTPYNTYTRGGLPPTPISMVGREAIHAALHPESTTALYFVAKGDGTHQFSDTLEQHNEAVRVYQLKRPKKK